MARSLLNMPKPNKMTSLAASRKSRQAAAKAPPQSGMDEYPVDLLDNKTEKRQVEIQTLHPGAIWIGKNFFSPAECDRFIQYSEKSAAYERKYHKATRMMAHRDCYELLHDDPRIAGLLFGRMKETGLMDVIEQSSNQWTPYGDTYRPIGCNPATKVYKYEKGMWFGQHIDMSDPMKEGQTEITVLVYLSECKGGATKFYPHGLKRGIAVQPEKGTILFHVHGDRCLDHEGEKVLKGTKYVLRTDVVFGHRY